MRAIPPLAITPAILTSSTCAEPHATETAYNAGTTYPLGATVVVAADHRTYQSLQAGNVGHTPISSPTWWLDIGPTLRWAMFDLLRNTQTIDASPLTVVLTPGVRVNSLALLGMVADTATVSVSSASNGGVVYSHTENLSTREVLDWYDYFFKPFSTRPSMVLFDLPPYTDAVITVTLTRASGNVSCGACVTGSYAYIGGLEYKAEADTLNFSTVTRDAFGNATLVPRRNVPKTRQTVWADKARVNAILDLRDALNAIPAVWSGLDDLTDDYFEALLILGIYKSFSISVAYPKQALVTLELEEI